MYDFSSPLQHLLDRERVTADSVFERLALQQLHGDEVLAVRLVNFANRADVWMIQRGRGESFPAETVCGRQNPFPFQPERTSVRHGFADHAHPCLGDDVKGRSIKV
jgi:hypothetical protein